MKRIVKCIPLESKKLYLQQGWTYHDAIDDATCRVCFAVDNGKTWIEEENIVVKKPYLIQRAKIEPLKGNAESVRFFNSVDLDYMGSAEFEWGALPAAMTRLRVQHFELQVYSLDSITNDGVALRYMTPHKGDDLNRIIDNLQKLRAGGLRLKEWTHFEPTEMRLDRCDLWWDIENDVIFSFNVNYMEKRLLKHLNTSFELIVNGK